MKLYSITRTDSEGRTQYYSFADYGPQWTDEIQENSFVLSREAANFWSQDPWTTKGSKDIKVRTYTLTEDE